MKTKADLSDAATNHGIPRDTRSRKGKGELSPRDFREKAAADALISEFRDPEG